MRLRLQDFGDDTASIKAFGLDVVADLCARLRAGGAPGMHFYTMNQSVAPLYPAAPGLDGVIQVWGG